MNQSFAGFFMPLPSPKTWAASSLSGTCNPVEVYTCATFVAEFERAAKGSDPRPIAVQWKNTSSRVNEGSFSMDLGLKEKVAVVTGSSRGIGRGIALGLALEGCRIVLCARNQVDLMKAEEAVRARNVETLALPLDITKPGSELQLVESTLRKFGRIDILVNNAGGNRRGRFEATTDVDWKEIIDLNLLSHVRISRAVVPHMRKQGEGIILFMASIFGRESGGPNLSIYNTTKSGIISLAKIMAVELAPHGIRVNSVAPGSIRFPGGSWDGRARENPEAIASFVERELPLGRFGTVEEVADVVVFLASKRAGLITGACISVDGCQSHCLI